MCIGFLEFKILIQEVDNDALSVLIFEFFSFIWKTPLISNQIISNNLLAKDLLVLLIKK